MLTNALVGDREPAGSLRSLGLQDLGPGFQAVELGDKFLLRQLYLFIHVTYWLKSRRFNPNGEVSNDATTESADSKTIVVRTVAPKSLPSSALDA